MAKVTALSSWRTGGTGDRNIQVELFVDNNIRTIGITLRPDAGHLELAESLHTFADAIMHDPCLNTGWWNCQTHGKTDDCCTCGAVTAFIRTGDSKL
jgi:hypothetical protein